MNKILIGLYEFDGPYSTEVEPEHQPGVIAILRHTADELEIIHLRAGEDVNVLWRRARAWYSNWQPQELSMAIYYMPGLSRSEVNRVLGDIFDEFEMAAA